MSTINFPGTSAYASTPQASWYTGRLAYRPVPPDPGDLPFTLDTRHQFRPDRLSFELYQTPNYWWVFCARNPFLRADPVWDFVAGLEIMLPSADALRRALGT